MSLAEPDDVVVAEAMVLVRNAPGSGGTEDYSYVLLHRTLDASAEPRPVRGARVVLALADGTLATLPESGELEDCFSELQEPFEGIPGTCYGPLERAGIGPGERVELRVTLPDGGTLEGVTVVPGPMALVGRPAGVLCHLPPGRTLDLTWSSSEGSWAYVAETRIVGLAPVFAPRGVEVDDPLTLLGLALSARDTTIVFPAELGIFDRADLAREVSLLLQEGLPAGTDATVAVAATDRNFVNWVRGGNFNPSGQVRVPSVRGDGTGFLGSAVVDRFQALVRDSLPEAPPCPGLEPSAVGEGEVEAAVPLSGPPAPGSPW